MFYIAFTRGAGAGGDQIPSIGLRHPSFKEEAKAMLGVSVGGDVGRCSSVYL